MSEEGKKPDPAPADEIKNIKAEMDRKVSNTDSKLATLQKQNEELIGKLNGLIQSTAPKKEATKEKPLSDLLYDDPEAYTAEIERRAESRIMDRLGKMGAEQTRKSAVTQSLVTEYPELANSSSELTQKALEIYNTFTVEEQTSSLAYKAAVAEAAVSLGVKPKSKRQDQDDFVMSGGGAGDAPRRSKEKDGISSKTADFARLMGLDPENAETKKNLAKHAKRDFTRYKG